MKTVLFVTGNKRKVWQANTTLESFGIQVQQIKLDVAEIQSHNPTEIAITKAKSAFELVQKPLIVCDHAWAIHALNGFPGGYMKDINEWFTADDFLALMRDKTDRSVTLTETIVYTDGESSKTFSVDFKGHIGFDSRGVGSVSGERVTYFDGSDKTIAENIDEGNHARAMEKSAWVLFGEWYKNEPTSQQ